MQAAPLFDVHRLAVAPMMDWTDRHCRYFLRLISRHALLYTEMVTASAVLRGDRMRLLGFDPAERLVALQLGGADPATLAEAARIGADFGYDEINLNVGCPSDRVQSGRFGACLMAEPDLVARAVAAMRAAVAIPVTVKCRIGIDDQDPWATLGDFAPRLRDAGCERLIVHARKAWLSGLSPKENREIPPLRYDLVYRLKQCHPEMTIVLNGGVHSHAAIDAHLRYVDGVMLGRAAYQTPWILAGADNRYFGADLPERDRHSVIRAYLPYVERELARGTPLVAMTRHILGLFQGIPGARGWRRHLSENACRPGADARVVLAALDRVPASAAAAAA